MPDLKTIIQITFPDDGVSVFVPYVWLCIVYVIITIKFLVDMGWSPSGDTGTCKKCAVNKISEKEGKMNISLICIVQYVFMSTYCFVLGYISWRHPNKRLPKLHRQKVDSLLSSNRAGGKCNNLEWRGRCVRPVYSICRKTLQTRRLELKNVRKLNKKLK